MATDTSTQAPPRRVVRILQRAADQSREYAPAKFAGQRNQQLDAAEAGVAEMADGPTLAADKAQGTPIVVESPTVHGGGTARRSQKPAQRMAPPPKGATWMGGLGSSSGVQNQILPDRASPATAVEELRDPEAVAAEDQIVPAAAGRSSGPDRRSLLLRLGVGNRCRDGRHRGLPRHGHLDHLPGSAQMGQALHHLRWDARRVL